MRKREKRRKIERRRRERETEGKKGDSKYNNSC